MGLHNASSSFQRASIGIYGFDSLVNMLGLSNMSSEDVELFACGRSGQTGNNGLQEQPMTRVATQNKEPIALLKPVSPDTCLGRLVLSMSFDLVITSVIILNVINLLVEMEYRTLENNKHPVWLVLEFIFTSIFAIEFIIKVAAYRLRYFLGAWNVFDFILVILGTLGVVLDSIEFQSTASQHSDFSAEARLIRANRVVRVMRLIRIFRLFRLLRILWARLMHEEIRLDFVDHLRRIRILVAFAQAHLASQADFVDFFGEHGQLRSPEQARCILQSHTEVYKALTLAAQVSSQVDASVLQGSSMLHASCHAAHRLAEFIEYAHVSGILSTREAETLLHPIRDRQRTWGQRLRRLHLGYEAKRAIGDFLEVRSDTRDEFDQDDVQGADAAAGKKKVVRQLKVSNRKTAQNKIRPFCP